MMETTRTLSFQLPKLQYDYSALEPYIDARTMEIHYTKHHAAYTNNLNAAIEGANYQETSIEDFLRRISQHNVTIRNNGGGYYNHNLLWEVMTPNKGQEPKGNLLQAIDSSFGSVKDFKDAFIKAAMGRFGSGWAWLIKRGNTLMISSTPNQDNPIMDVAEIQGTPILGIDLWEHAYYLKYQNRRAEYIEAFWHVINWEEVERRFNG